MNMDRREYSILYLLYESFMSIILNQQWLLFASGSRSISPGNRRHRNAGNMAGGGGGSRRDYRRYSRSRSRSRSR